MDTTPLALAPYVAAEIRAEMARQSMTSAALALRVGRPKQTVHRWTAGQTPISLDDIPLICEALDVELGELLTAAVSLRDREVAAVAAGGHVNTRCSLRAPEFLTLREPLPYAV